MRGLDRSSTNATCREASQIENVLALSTIFESVVVFGSGMTSPFAIAVLVPGKRIESQSPSGRDAIAVEVNRALDQTNGLLEHHEHLRFVVLCNQPWIPENGMMTPTMKVRRPILEQRFGPLFAEWDNSGERIIWMETL